MVVVNESNNVIGVGTRRTEEGVRVLNKSDVGLPRIILDSVQWSNEDTVTRVVEVFGGLKSLTVRSRLGMRGRSFFLSSRH